MDFTNCYQCNSHGNSKFGIQRWDLDCSYKVFMKEGQASLFYLKEGGKNVDRIDVVAKVFIATFGGFCGYFLGGWDATLKILVTMAVIDYVTGMIAAGYNGELKSKVGFKGIAKKVVLFLLVGAAAQLDAALGSNSAIREATIFSSWVMSYFHF